MKRLRTALIGLGRIGWMRHAPDIVRHNDKFEFVAVVDPVETRLQEAHAEWGVRGYKDHETMLAKEKPDLVVIASPTIFHLEQAKAVFKAGADVFCDKPVAVSLAETDAMIALMEKYGRKLMVFQPHRANSYAIALKKIIELDLLGEIFMHKRVCSRYARRNDWQAFKKNGGGMLFNYGAHYVDQTLHFANAPVKRLNCVMGAIVTLGDADDFVKLMMETENNIVIDLEINMAAALPSPTWQVFGKRGTASLDNEDGDWRVRYVNASDLPSTAIQTGLAAEARRYGSGEVIPWKEEIVDSASTPEIDFYEKCYEYYALGLKPFVPINETREIMRLLEAARNDAGW